MKAATSLVPRPLPSPQLRDKIWEWPGNEARWQPHSQSSRIITLIEKGLFIFVFLLLLATIFNNANQQINVYGDDIEVDYRGYEVNFNTQ